MDTASIEREVRRLAPWYYRLNINGVSTDITPPCDPGGHRVISFPQVHDGFWRGKTVLDVGCNEGAFSFGAIEHGAERIDAFDCREINLEKGRFVAQVRGYDNVDFHFDTTDSWIEKHAGETYDVVLMCAIINHLPDPQRAIRDFCRVGEWIFVTCGYYGGDDGWTRVIEDDYISASNEGEPALMPNSTDTLIDEFATNGFRPLYVEETRRGFFAGGCCLFLRKISDWPGYREQPMTGSEADGFRIFLVPETVTEPAGRVAPCDLHVTVFNRTTRARSLAGKLTLRNAEGAVQMQTEQPVALPALPASSDEPASRAIHEVARLDLASCGPGAAVDVELSDAGEVVAARRLTIERP